jgi:hypothetical protein
LARTPELVTCGNFPADGRVAGQSAICRRGNTSTSGPTASSRRPACKTTPEGRKELIGLRLGVRESAQGWREPLVEGKAAGNSKWKTLPLLTQIGDAKAKPFRR